MEKFSENKENNLDRIRERKEFLVSLLADDMYFDWHKKVIERAKYLESKYPDAQRMIAFHIMLGSTPPEYATITQDFPGEDSVEKFHEDLIKEYSSGNL